MVAYSFKAHFRDPILHGTKRQTLRNPRKRHAMQGEELQLYTGMRTSSCKIIGIATCVDVRVIRLDLEHGRIETPATGFALTTPDEIDGFAQMDGFTNWREMARFWEVNHPGVPLWEGVVIRWRDLVVPA